MMMIMMVNDDIKVIWDALDVTRIVVFSVLN